VDEILDITFVVVDTFDRLGIPYLVGGSLASSLYGIPRATQDVDIVARLTQRDVPALVSALRETFYLDQQTILEAVELRGSFNLIHLGTFLKVDIFVAKDDEPSRSQMERRRRYEIDGDPPRSLVVASPEDVVAHKLYWYELGDGVSDRQWSDVLGVLRVAGDRLDLEYLHRTAALLGIQDLLERALDEVG
jgi:hypothetical protein